MLDKLDALDKTLRLPSPAKLNLFLHITGQRADGYHDLQSVFALIDWYDYLTFEATQDGAITLIHAMADVADKDNLVYKAAKLLQTYTQTTLGCQIAIEKNIPTGGGLGGGSSNAATTLLALNALWQTNLSVNTLASLGLQLGADVPIFVYGHSAWAEGVGEQLTPISIDTPYYVVLKPNCHIATKDIFGYPALCRNTPPTASADFYTLYAQQALHNDCEPVAKKVFSQVAQALDYLHTFEHHALQKAMLTGTGACVFMPLLDKDLAEHIVQHAPCEGRVCLGLAQSPVHAFIHASING